MLILTSPIVSLRDIKWSVVTAGRVLEVQFIRGAPVTLLNVCQQVWRTNISALEISLVVNLHHEVKYNLQYGNMEGSCTSTTGIKQGCKLAPSLFALVISIMFLDVGLDLPEGEIQNNLTGFADDIIIHKLILSVSDFHQAYRNILLLLTNLEDLGMQVNKAQCNIIIRLAGRQAKKLKKQRTTTITLNQVPTLVWLIPYPTDLHFLAHLRQAMMLLEKKCLRTLSTFP